MFTVVITGVGCQPNGVDNNSSKGSSAAFLSEYLHVSMCSIPAWLPFGKYIYMNVLYIHKYPDSWHRIKNCFDQWVEQVFRFYERYIRENSQARKRKTTQCNVAELNQPRPNKATLL